MVFFVVVVVNGIDLRFGEDLSLVLRFHYPAARSFLVLSSSTFDAFPPKGNF